MATRKPTPRVDAASTATPRSSGSGRKARAATSPGKAGGRSVDASSQASRIAASKTEPEPKQKGARGSSSAGSAARTVSSSQAEAQVDPRAEARSASEGAPRVLAIANQKGGVGKSTTAVSLGAALAEIGYRVLVIDLDPQGNASTGMGIRHEAREVTVYEVLANEGDIERAIIPTVVDGLDAIPSTIDLAGAEIELVSQFSRELRLRKALEPLRSGSYDFIFLDCPPSLGLLTINALAAAEELIVPIQCEYYALEGLGQLLRNVRLVQQNVNPRLRLTGIVLTMFDPRTKLSEQVVDEVRRYFGERVYDVVIPRTVRLSEAPGYGQPITQYDPRSRGAECYRELAKEVAERPFVGDPLPAIADLPLVSAPPRVGAAAHEAVAPASESPLEAEVDVKVDMGGVSEAAPSAAPARPSAEPEPGATVTPKVAPEAPPPQVESREAAGAGASEPGPEAKREVEGDAASPPGGPSADARSAAARPDDEGSTAPPPVEARAREAVEDEADEELEEDIAYADVAHGHRRRAEGARHEEPPTQPPRVLVIDDKTGLGDERRVTREGSAPSSATATPMDESTMGTFEEPLKKRRWRLFRKGGDEG